MQLCLLSWHGFAVAVFNPIFVMIPRCVFLLAGLCSLLTPAAHAKSASGETTAPLPGRLREESMDPGRNGRALDGGFAQGVDQRLESTGPGFLGRIRRLSQGRLAPRLDHPSRRQWRRQRSRRCPAAFVQGTRASWAHRSLVKDYLGHQFRFLRAHSLGGRPGLLFRSSGENGQLNYCFFSVVTAPDGSLGADDLYVVGMGEWVSDTLRRGYLTLVESLAPRGESGRRARLYLEALPRITAMQVALAKRIIHESSPFPRCSRPRCFRIGRSCSPAWRPRRRFPSSSAPACSPNGNPCTPTRNNSPSNGRTTIWPPASSRKPARCSPSSIHASAATPI